MIRRPPRSTRTDTLFPCTTLFRSRGALSPDRIGFALEASQFVRNTREPGACGKEGSAQVVAGLDHGPPARSHALLVEAEGGCGGLPRLPPQPPQHHGLAAGHLPRPESIPRRPPLSAQNHTFPPPP